MKKIIFICVLFLMLTFEVSSVFASEYYVNPNGVVFNAQQLNYISDMYYVGYQDTMTQIEFDKIVELDLFKQPIITVEQNSMNSKSDYAVMGNSSTQYGVTTTITKSCTTQCLVTLKATWSVIPSIKSFDVIGFRLANATIDTINKATISGNNYSVTYQPSEAKVLDNGFGYSIKLGNSVGLKITTSMYTSRNGTIFGSYQHANYNVTLGTSKLYNISPGGYGNVFSFYGDAMFKYNNATGVDITL